MQHKFFRFASSALKIKRKKFDHDNIDIAKHLNLPSINSVFQVNDLSFIFKVRKRFLDCADLLNYIKKPNHSHMTRHPNSFDLPYYLHGSPMYRPQKLANEYRKELPFNKQIMHQTFTKQAKKTMSKYK